MRKLLTMSEERFQELSTHVFRGNCDDEIGDLLTELAAQRQPGPGYTETLMAGYQPVNRDVEPTDAETVSEPDWETCSDEVFKTAAQKSFRRYREVLRRLASGPEKAVPLDAETAEAIRLAESGAAFIERESHKLVQLPDRGEYLKRQASAIRLLIERVRGEKASREKRSDRSC
jgi:hypothetical protein